MKRSAKEKQSLEMKTEDKETDSSLNELEKAVDKLQEKVKKIARKNGFSKKLKQKVELELN